VGGSSGARSYCEAATCGHWQSLRYHCWNSETRWNRDTNLLFDPTHINGFVPPSPLDLCRLRPVLLLNVISKN